MKPECSIKRDYDDGPNLNLEQTPVNYDFKPGWRGMVEKQSEVSGNLRSAVRGQAPVGRSDRLDRAVVATVCRTGAHHLCG
jgi:hypothetical protein